MNSNERESIIEVERLKWEEVLDDWMRAHNKDRPRLLVDKADRPPYREYDESKGPLNQIRIRAASGLVDLGEESRIVKSIETYRAYKAFVASEDDVAVDLIERLGN